MLVFVASNGKTLELAVQSSYRVDAVQQALAAHTGIPVSEQIVMCNGTPLDPTKPLAAYNLPGYADSKPQDVFLYNKNHLRSGAALPLPEPPLPPIPEVPAPQSVRYEPHMLDEAGSPLVRALPDYERQFRYHLTKAQAHCEGSQQRYHISQQLLSEMEVQAMAIDAARANVEQHYSFICNEHSVFMRKYVQQHTAHAETLVRFEQDMAQLAATELQPAARTRELTRLVHLVPEQRLRDWAANCGRSHKHFADKVSELEGLFGGLKSDVESLFMTAPSVDLDELGRQMEDRQRCLDQQTSIVQVLTSDFDKVQSLVEETVRQLRAGPSASSVQPLDACHVMETMHDSHVSQLLPQIQEADAQVERFAQHCLNCKNQMTRDVFGQLQKISAQQSKIRNMRNKLAAFKEVAMKQAEAFAELLLVRRIPAAYAHCLSECVRRKAFAELYSGQASQLAERMGRIRAKEVTKRDAFIKHVEAYIPKQVLANMGLLLQPPHCQINVPAAESNLLQVSVEELRRLRASLDLQASVKAVSPFAEPGRSGLASSSAPEVGLLLAASLRSPPPPPEADKEDVEAADTDYGGGQSLEMENARLRADLAAHIALECSRFTNLPQHLDSSASGGPASPGTPGARPPSFPSSPAGAASPHQQLASSSQEAGQKFREALQLKDELVGRLQRELEAARRQAAAYVHRIHHLEDRLAQASTRGW
ncbi:hypothetical protein WJX72_010464 [[Myrmecia] bisecta]|uniref:Ubiquitin-like domain-containing protein n=1 Tax=[Myrmecia] bisecta TaxID=41462 RepID=A0AAW1QGB0_9CHLO